MKTLKRLLSLLLFLGLLWAFWFLATHDFSRPAPKPSPVPAPDPWADMLTAALHVFVIGVMALLLAAGMAALYALLLHTRHRAQMATPDGRAPLSHPLAARWYDVREAEARRLTLPTTLTWSPSTTISRTGAEREMVAPEAIVHQPALSAEEALALPGIVYGRRLSDGELLTDTGVRSLAIGGRPGTGKTTTAVILAAQCVRLGASLEIVDPHAGHPESLTARMEPLLGRLPAAETPREALALVQKVHDILQQRKDSWRRSRNGVHGPDSPVALFLDEFPELVRLLSPSERQRMLDLIATIGYSSRKYGVATILLAQSWLVAAVGSSQIRNPVPAAIVHGMRADEARSLTGIPAGGWPLDPQMLGDQEAVVVGVASGPVHVRVPTLDPTHARAREEWGPNSDSVLAEPSLWAPRMLNGSAREHGPSTERAQAEHPYEHTILDLARQHIPPREIVRRIWGLEKTGAAYTARLNEVWDVVSRALQEST